MLGIYFTGTGNSRYVLDIFLKKYDKTADICALTDKNITHFIKENEKIKVVLENTAFYPEGGGQPSDTGVIDDVKVFRVEEKNSKNCFSISMYTSLNNAIYNTCFSSIFKS